MKRILILLSLLLAASSLYAVDFDFVIGQKTGASLDFDNSQGNFKPSFNFNVDAELDMDFDEGHGMMVGINPYAENGQVKFGLSVGYAYRLEISRNTDFMFSVGPILTFASSGVGFAVFVDENFDFILTDLIFIRVGTGVELGFGEFTSSEFGRKDLTMLIPLPYIGVGFQF